MANLTTTLYGASVSYPDSTPCVLLTAGVLTTMAGIQAGWRCATQQTASLPSTSYMLWTLRNAAAQFTTGGDFSTGNPDAQVGSQNWKSYAEGGGLVGGAVATLTNTTMAGASIGDLILIQDNGSGTGGSGGYWVPVKVLTKA